MVNTGLLRIPRIELPSLLEIKQSLFIPLRNKKYAKLQNRFSSIILIGAWTIWKNLKGNPYRGVGKTLRRRKLGTRKRPKLGKTQSGES